MCCLMSMCKNGEPLAHGPVVACYPTHIEGTGPEGAPPIQKPQPFIGEKEGEELVCAFEVDLIP